MLPSAPLPDDFVWTDPQFIAELHDAAVRRARPWLRGDLPLLAQHSAERVIDRIVLSQRDKRFDGAPTVYFDPTKFPTVLTEYYRDGVSAFEPTTMALCIETIQRIIESTWQIAAKTSDLPAGSTNNPSEDLYDLYDTLEEWRSDLGLHADGFERRYPRTITNTSDSGASGQKARLVQRVSGRIARMSAPVYVHDGAGWVRSRDPADFPDVVVGHGLAQPGDYIGRWTFNEILGALSRTTLVVASPGYGLALSVGGNFTTRWRALPFSDPLNENGWIDATSFNAAVAGARSASTVVASSFSGAGSLGSQVRFTPHPAGEIGGGGGFPGTFYGPFIIVASRSTRTFRPTAPIQFDLPNRLDGLAQYHVYKTAYRRWDRYTSEPNVPIDDPEDTFVNEPSSVQSFPYGQFTASFGDEFSTDIADPEFLSSGPYRNWRHEIKVELGTLWLKFEDIPPGN